MHLPQHENSLQESYTTIVKRRVYHRLFISAVCLHDGLQLEKGLGVDYDEN